VEIDTYAPLGANEEESEVFYQELQKTVEKVKKSDMLILMVDFSARIVSV
jgi:hypothetical protein